MRIASPPGIAGGSCRSGQESITTHLIDNLAINLQPSVREKSHRDRPSDKSRSGPSDVLRRPQHPVAEATQVNRPFLSRSTIHHRLKHQTAFNRKLIIQQSLPDFITLQHTFVVGQKTQMPTDIDAEDGNVEQQDGEQLPERSIPPRTTARSGIESSLASRPGDYPGP